MTSIVTMKLPFLKSKTAGTDKESTVAPSSSPSDTEKDIPNTSSRSPSVNAGEKKVIEETPLEEAEALDKLDDENEYPTGAKLGIITASLCLSVFLMALVGLPFLAFVRDTTTSISNNQQDNTIIATAIPKITDHFQALDDVGWYGSGGQIYKDLLGNNALTLRQHISSLHVPSSYSSVNSTLSLASNGYTSSQSASSSSAPSSAVQHLHPLP